MPPSSGQTPNKVTINIKTPKHPLNGDTASDMSEDRRDSHLDRIASLELNKDEIASERTLSNGDASPLAPSEPDIEIEIEIVEPEDLEDDSAVQIISLDDDLVYDTLAAFPFVKPGGTTLDAVKLYLEHMDSGTFSSHGGQEELKDPNLTDIIDLNAVDTLATWFDTQHETFKQSSSLWRDFYCENREIWDGIGSILHKFFSRS